MSKCKYCQSEVEAGALKCPKCLEWLAPRNDASSGGNGYPILKFVADSTKALAWPVFFVVLITLFRDDVSQLLIRAKSLEIAGTKSEFVEYAAVVGYLQGKVGELAEETDPAKRAALQVEIKETVENLSGLHPLSLGFLISIGRGVSRDDAWEENQNAIFELQQRGFVELEPLANSPEEVTKTTNARLKESGKDFLRGIGFDNVR